MEESNIRWGEIVGGLLIIGCSTALVVSLWSQISQIPVLKFLIFTTVTAVLFGIGLYTEHRWKLPTTSRGILTTATLLVPLNFLAIAAVSAGAEPHGAVVIGSELIAPAVFLCLVYFAGRVLTPMWPHLLAAGVLGSSVGQLLIRHFASPELSPGLLVVLGAFPVVCYVASAVWMLKKALADREIDEAETIAIFVSLGALTFAAVLPFASIALQVWSSGNDHDVPRAAGEFGWFPPTRNRHSPLATDLEKGTRCVANSRDKHRNTWCHDSAFGNDPGLAQSRQHRSGGAIQFRGLYCSGGLPQHSPRTLAGSILFWPCLYRPVPCDGRPCCLAKPA